VLVDYPSDAFFHGFAREIQKQPKGLLKQSKVGQKLLGVGAGSLINRLDLQHQAIFNQDVDLESSIESLTVECYWHNNLPRDPQSAPFKSASQNRFVDTLEQAGPKFTMNRDRFSNYIARKLFDSLH
jgi:hypothetical protein